MSTPGRIERLAPPPRTACGGGEPWRVPALLRLQAPAELLGSPALVALQDRLAAHGVTLTPEGAVGLELERIPGQQPESYQLEVGAAGAHLRGADAAGLAHGLRTLAQWVALHAGEGPLAPLQAVRIDDAPSFPERGVMLDVARDRRPTLETLFELVERLASLKVNRLQLYMEADFDYDFGRAATRGRSPYSAAELRALDDHCAERGIELVPNQQCFGHMHHWLREPEWNALAEVPTGVEHPFSRDIEPFSLCPTDPGSLALLERMFDELLPCFRSSSFNVGLDETFDLGQGRSASACETRGKHAVYLDFLRDVHELVTARGKRMQFWGDIVLEQPELCTELPEDVVALDWGYEADHPFDTELASLAAAGREFHVCPGTSSWNSFVGRTPNASANLHAAARSGAAHGARGLLVTDWGDRGHLQPWTSSAAGFVLGASLAWNAESDEHDARLADWLDAWWFEDRAGVLGRAALELGRLQEVVGDRCKNGNAAFFLVVFGERSLEGEHFVGLTSEGLEAGRQHLVDALARISSADCTRTDGALLASELELARDLAGLGVDLGLARLAGGGRLLAELGAAERAAFAGRLRALATRHGELWTQRNRPGGREASLRWLEALQPVLSGQCDLRQRGH